MPQLEQATIQIKPTWVTKDTMATALVALTVLMVATVATVQVEWDTILTNKARCETFSIEFVMDRVTATDTRIKCWATSTEDIEEAGLIINSKLHAPRKNYIYVYT